MQFLGKFRVLGLDITACDYDFLISQIIKKKKKLIIAPIASHPIVLANKDNDYKGMLNKFNYLVPDGQSVIFALRFLYKIKLNDRVYGPKLFLKLCELSEKQKFKIFLIGNDTGLLIKKIKTLYPKTKIVADIDLKHKKINNFIIRDINLKIKKIKPKLIFIGIGSPVQHLLATKLLTNNSIICIGAAFDFLIKTKQQAPKWVQNAGVEWLYRLIKEPVRLWKRYLLYGSIYLLLVLIQKYSKKVDIISK